MKLIIKILLLLISSCAHKSIESLKEANKDSFDVIKVKTNLSKTYKSSLAIINKCFGQSATVYTGAGIVEQPYYVEEVKTKNGKSISIWNDIVLNGKSIIGLVEFKKGKGYTKIIIYGYGMNGSNIKKIIKNKKC